ncbi:MAG: T9SS type A sorting domain-containing protein [Bacteroidetes bacterium]|nr:T9SS type A sorting domain-containing protein [Bacteroidota bacterium]
MKKNYAIQLLLTLCLLGTTTLSKAANYYWVGGTGSWSDVANHWATASGGSVFHVSIPTINDDVIIDANSFTAPGQQLLFDSTFYFCHSMTWTGVTNHPAFVGNGSTLNLYGSFVLDTGMDITSVDVKLLATTSGFVLNTAGHQLYSVTIEGVGSYTLAGELNCTGEVLINHGMLNSGGYNIDCGNFTVSSGATYVPGATTLTVHGLPNDFYARHITISGVVNSPNLWVLRSDAPMIEFVMNGSGNLVDSVIFTGLSTVRHLSANYIYIGGYALVDNCSFVDGVFDGIANMYTASFTNLTAVDVVISSNSTLQVSGTLTMNGDCNNFASLSSDGATVGGQATLNVPSGTVQLDYISIGGIIATGGATFIANNAIDVGGNSGWSFTALTSRNLYWIGGTGDWHDSSHWSLSSGGTSVGCAPNRYDNVFFDANSFSGNDSVHFGTSAEMADMNVSSTGFTPVYDGDHIYVFGSFNVTSTLNWRVTTLDLTSPDLGKTLHGGGNSYGYVQKSSAGSYILTDSLICTVLSHRTGYFDLNSQSVSVNALASDPSGEFNMTSAHIYAGIVQLRGTQTGSATCDITFDRQGGILYNSGNYRNILWIVDGTCDSNLIAQSLIAQGDLAMGTGSNIHLAEIKGNLTMTGSNTFDSLYLNNSGYTMAVASGAITTINDALFANTDCNHYVTLRSADVNTPTTLQKSAGSIDLNYVQLIAVSATGGAAFNATNSVDGGGNSGWNISANNARTLYWVNGPGNWSDSSHWSLSSGGAGGECIPSGADAVIFDASSLVSSSTVVIDNANSSCASIDFTNAGTAVTVTGSSLTVYGAFDLASGMTWSVDYVNLKNLFGGTITINSSNVSLLDLELNGNGTIELSADLICRSLDVTGGSFLSQGHDMQASRIHSNAGTTFTTGPITVQATHFEIEGTLLNSKSTDVEMRVFSPVFYGLGRDFKTPGSFHNITLYMPNARIWAYPIKCEQLVSYALCQVSAIASDTIGKAIFHDYVMLGGQFVIDPLFFANGGQTTNLQGTVQINNQFIVNGSPNFPVYLKGVSNFSLINNGADICLSNALVEGIIESGSAQFFAGNGCVDMGGNANVQFTPCTVTSDVWPGDANYDLNCDNLDILNVGVAFNETGPVRTSASNLYVAQPAADFGNWFGGAVNMKHADCDGNGVVDINDTIPIGLNYGQTHPARHSFTPNTSNTINAPQLYLDATPDTVLPSGGVHVDIMMGTNQLPVDSMYGIAFTLDYDPTLIDTNSIQIDWTGSWLGTAGTDLITFVRHTPTIGRIDVALTRNDHQNVGNGIGHLGMFDVVVVDNISTVTNALFRLSNVSAITYSQQILATARVNDTVTIDPNWNAVEQIHLSSHFLIYPNPATDQLNVYSHDLQIKEVLMFDLAGREVRHMTSGLSQISIPLSGIRSGLYQLQCRSDKGVYNTYVNIVAP